MRALTIRGIRLKRRFRRLGFRVIEIYPGAAQDVWGIPRKQFGLGRLRRGMEALGYRGLDRSMNGDELDAVSGAIVGRMHLLGKAEVLGNFRQGAIVVPIDTSVRSKRKGKL
jgi:predicted nuclease with RNAse H fold